ncbi:MAG: hypothetical protein IT464_14985 [Planctomycetes bacterium]|nr:hypothetical protein [Planctomycetota bacterium]
MRHMWLFLLMAASVSIFAAAANAQRLPQVLNMNTHEGKFATGGVGLQIGFGTGFGGELHREGPASKVVDGALEAVFRRRFAQTHSRFVLGAKLDFQIGSDNDVIGTDFGIEFYNISISTSGSAVSGTNNLTVAPNTDPVYRATSSSSASLIYFGFDFTINFYKSEFIETDGRRTRNNWGLALIVGPKAGMLMGDFADLNGFATAGLDLGLMADFPIPIPGAEDLLSISPYAIFEINYRFGVDTALVDSNPASPTFGQDVLNDSFDLDYYSASQEDQDGNGLPDYDGIAIRRHNFIPAYQLSLGTTVNLTPIFISRSGGLINNWRFWMSATVSFPLGLNFIMANYVGDSLWGADELPTMSFTFSFGAAYFF